MAREWLEDQGRQDWGWWTQLGGGLRTGQAHIHMQINQEEQIGSEIHHATQSSSMGRYSLKPLTENTCGGWGGSGRNSQPYRRVRWKDPRGPRMYTSPPTRESAPEGLNLIVGSGGSDRIPAESRASGIVPSQTPPPHTASQRSDVGCPTLVNT